MTRESLLILPDTNLADLLTLERSFFFSLARMVLILPGVSGTVAMNWMCWPHVVAKCARSQIEGGGHDDGECFARERCAEQREGLVHVEVWKCVRIALELLVALRSPSCLAAVRGDGRRSDSIRRPSHSHSFAAIASVSRWVSRTRPPPPHLSSLVRGQPQRLHLLAHLEVPQRVALEPDAPPARLNLGPEPVVERDRLGVPVQHLREREGRSRRRRSRWSGCRGKESGMSRRCGPSLTSYLDQDLTSQHSLLLPVSLACFTQHSMSLFPTPADLCSGFT